MVEETNQAVWAYLDELCPGIQQRLPQLTARQLDVMLSIGLGHGAKQTAGRLQIAVKTVESHIADIKRKLHIADYRTLGVVSTMLTFREWVVTKKFERAGDQAQVV